MTTPDAPHHATATPARIPAAEHATAPAVPRTVSRATARRYLVHHHLLAPPRALPPGPASVMTVANHLGSLQFDPLEVAGRNHDLVLQARIKGYRRAHADTCLYEDRTLFEAYNKSLNILPAAELPWHRWTWDRHRVAHDHDTFGEHAPLVEELLAKIRDGGPLSPTDVEPRAAIDWYWRPTNQVRAILEALAESGIIGITRRDGNRRIYDLVERLHPPELLAHRPPEREQLRHRVMSRFRAHGLLGTGGSGELWIGLGLAKADPARPDRPNRTEIRNSLIEDGLLVPVAVEGIRAPRYIRREDLPALALAEREVSDGLPPGGTRPAASFLAPLDPLCWDRQLLRDLFDFDYIWEVYVPEAKRRWGYYVLPILFGDRLVGRFEPRIDRKARAIRVLGTWWEAGFDPLGEDGFVAAFAGALDDYRAFAGATKVTFGRDKAARALAGAVARAR